GKVLSLSTCTSKAAIFEKDGAVEIMEPLVKPDPFEKGLFTVTPLKISFEGHYVRFENNIKRIYDVNTTRFTIINNDGFKADSAFSCGDCSSCSLCKKSSFL
ncbi:MAG TPA: hypothetical protein VHP38_12565, partial [Ruminiclostridium sp.]|nr:hypothetical protein [Ruminiclostridium sp.]